MKEFVKAILPRLRQVHWKLDAVARISKKPWTVIEESGAYAQIVFRKNGELLFVQSGEVANGRWEIVEEMAALVVEIGTSKKMYDAGWGDGPIMFLREHGSERGCVLIDANWMKAENARKLMSLVVSQPSLLEFDVDWLRFEDGLIAELEDGRELRTMKSDIFEENGYGSNEVIVDWKPAPDGLYWKKGGNGVFEVVDGGLWVYYLRSNHFEVANIGRCWLLLNQNTRGAKDPGNFFMCEEGFVPDGEYKVGWFKKIQVKDGRVA